MTRALVIGYGSIGARHARILDEMGLEVAVVSRRETRRSPCFKTTDEALSEFGSEYVVIANETSRHRDTLRTVAGGGHTGPILVEKPLFDAAEPDVTLAKDAVFVGYDMRMHPLLRRLRERLAAAAALSAELHVGQHLSLWRPGRDYRETYSAKTDEGGGVLRDLSHEIDYALWLFGPWRRLTALGGSSGALEMDADDHFTVLMECERCPAVTVTMNCYEKTLRRHAVVHTADDTLTVDFAAGSITSARESSREMVEIDGDYVYRAEHEAVLSERTEDLCDYSSALAVVRTIEALERAAREGIWVSP